MIMSYIGDDVLSSSVATCKSNAFSSHCIKNRCVEMHFFNFNEKK